MGYAEYIEATLKPLNVYDPSGKIISSEIEVCGVALDEVYEALCRCEAEMLPLTAGEYGLAMYEKLLPYAPESENIEDRRAAIAALMMTDNSTVTAAKLNRSLCGCGINAHASETGVSQVVSIGFPDRELMPDNINALKDRIAKLLPCHLVSVYEWDFITWQELDTANFIWSRFESEGLEWISFLIYEF